MDARAELSAGPPGARGPSQGDDDPHGSQGPDESLRASLLAGLRVLVVDDDEGSAKLLEVVLRDEGCDVRAVGSAEDALALLASFHPRVLVTDLVLPLMSGFLLTQQLRERPATRDLIIIAVTRFHGPDVRRATLDAGFTGYVQKPVDPVTFPRIVLSHVGPGQ